MLLSLGLLFAFYALAQRPESPQYNNYVDPNQNTLFNTSGFPDQKGYDTWVENERLRTNLGTHRVSSSVRCSCVLFARYFSGINTGSVGWAKYWPINSDSPATNAIVVFTGTTGHVAVVLSYTDTTITITESNYVHCTITSGRVVSRNQTNIKGYYVSNPN